MTKPDLSASMMSRISETARAELASRAAQEGIKPSHWARRAVYKALGLTPAGEKSGKK